MAAGSPLPFDAFLEVLRAKGYGIGLHEYAAMATLLDRWDRLHATELGDALAALIARNEEELTGIRRLFDELYAPLPPPQPPPPPAPPDPLAFVRRHAWTLALVSAIVMLVAAGFAIVPRPPRPKPVIAEVPPVPTQTLDQALTIPPPPAPPLPAPPLRLQRRPMAEALAGGFLAALAFFWSMKVRDDTRAWARDAWSAVRALLPGPYHFDTVVRGRAARLPKADVEDAATLLGRVFSKRALARELDVPRSLRATLRRGTMPTLITKPRRIAETILVVQDVSQEMRLWDAKVDGFLSDLRRQGIALQRMYFDGDLSRVSERPHRPSKPIDTILRASPDAPVMIVSSGTGLAAILTEDDPPMWLRQLGARLRKTWLTPVSDVRLWPREFARLPIDVWPMTQLGLTNAARQLAGVQLESGTDVRARIAAEGAVTLEDLERLKRLASLVPHPSPALLDLLRLRFAPDVPDAAILHLMLQAEGPAAPLIRLTDEELRRFVAAVRRENPDLEVLVRQTVLTILLDSEPIAGSAAHERWKIAVETQRMLLADAEGAPERAAESVDALRTLSRGPMWEEVQDALRIVPQTAAMAERVDRIAVPNRRAPMPSARQLPGTHRLRWSWPGLREVVPATLAAGMLLAGAVALHALPELPVEHVQEAYNLDYAATPSISTPRLNITPRWRGDGLPRTVDLYQGDRVFRSNIALTDGIPTTVPLAAADTGNYYQVRARLPENNLAVSKAVWVASDKLAFVLIDASPWANVTISGGSTATTTRVQQTPFTAALAPGTYQVHFENPSLTPSTLDRTITVPVAGNAFHVVMPGFDPAATADRLVRQNIQTMGR